MKDFDQILDECIHALMSGTATLEDCLRRYPVEARALEPLLRSAAGLRSIHSVHPSPAYKRRARLELKRHMQAHPRGAVRAARLSPIARVTFSMMVLLFALMVTGTAFAQGSLPGDSFYSWKLTSERVWRAVSPDPVGTDLILADRRMQEYLKLSSDPAKSDRALQGYKEVLTRLNSESDEGSRGRIETVLQGHEVSLQNSGVTVPVLDEVLKNVKPDKKDPGTNNGKGPDKDKHPTPDHPQPNPQGQGQGHP